MEISIAIISVLKNFEKGIVDQSFIKTLIYISSVSAVQCGKWVNFLQWGQISMIFCRTCLVGINYMKAAATHTELNHFIFQNSSTV